MNLLLESILDCNTDAAIEKHNQKIEKTLTELWNMNALCLATIRRIDVGATGKYSIMRVCTQDIEEIILSCDFKNGVDVFLVGNGDYIFFVHGQGYTLNGIYHLVKTEIHIHILPR